MYYIYVLYSIEADKYYVGHSNDQWRRLEQHLKNGADKFTGRYKDWKLKAVFNVSEGKGETDRLEKFIKKQKSRVLIERLIDPAFIPEGKLAQLVRVPHVRD